MPATNFEISEDNGLVRATGICCVTQQPYTVQVPADQYAKWQEGELIQRAMPRLTKEQREFFMTHMTPAEWDAVFAEEDED